MENRSKFGIYCFELDHNFVLNLIISSQGTRIVSAEPAAGHLSSSSLYPACKAPFVILTSCSDDVIRFWKCIRNEKVRYLDYWWHNYFAICSLTVVSPKVLVRRRCSNVLSRIIPGRHSVVRMEGVENGLRFAPFRARSRRWNIRHFRGAFGPNRVRLRLVVPEGSHCWQGQQGEIRDQRSSIWTSIWLNHAQFRQVVVWNVV